MLPDVREVLCQRYLAMVPGVYDELDKVSISEDFELSALTKPQILGFRWAMRKGLMDKMEAYTEMSVGRQAILQFMREHFGVTSWRTCVRWRRRYFPFRTLHNGKPFLIHSEALLFSLKFSELKDAVRRNMPTNYYVSSRSRGNPADSGHDRKG